MQEEKLEGKKAPIARPQMQEPANNEALYGQAEKAIDELAPKPTLRHSYGKGVPKDSELLNG
jgi:hypothetical protein